MEAQHGVRYRVNVSTSTKGYHSYDATVEITNDVHHESTEQGMQGLDGVRDELLRQSDALVAALEARYPNGEIVPF